MYVYMNLRMYVYFAINGKDKYLYYPSTEHKHCWYGHSSFIRCKRLDDFDWYMDIMIIMEGLIIMLLQAIISARSIIEMYLFATWNYIPNGDLCIL